MPRSSSRPLLIAELREGEAAAVADLGVVHAELVTVIAKGERLLEIVGQRLEPAEMPRPAVLVELEPDPFRPAALTNRGMHFGKRRRLDRVVEIRPEVEDLRVGAIVGHCRVSGRFRNVPHPSMPSRQCLQLGERGAVRLVGRDRRGELAGAVEQQDGRGMLHLLAHRRVGHGLGENAILLLDLVDLRLAAGQADDRRAEQFGILADFLRSVVGGIDGDEDDAHRMVVGGPRRSLTSRDSVVGQTSPQRVKPK